jgi:hypothetical protein
LNNDKDPIENEILTIPSTDKDFIKYLKSINLIYPTFYDKIYNIFDQKKLFWSSDEMYYNNVIENLKGDYIDYFNEIYKIEKEKASLFMKEISQEAYNYFVQAKNL